MVWSLDTELDRHSYWLNKEHLSRIFKLQSGLCLESLKNYQYSFESLAITNVALLVTCPPLRQSQNRDLSEPGPTFHEDCIERGWKECQCKVGLKPHCQNIIGSWLIITEATDSILTRHLSFKSNTNYNSTLNKNNILAFLIVEIICLMKLNDNIHPLISWKSSTFLTLSVPL